MKGVPFAEIEAALGRTAHGARAPRAHTATVVVIGSAARVNEAADTLRQLSGGLRGLLISTGERAQATADVDDNLVVIEGLKKAHVNNAVAALRLSSLPTLVWWRGGDADTLEGIAALADRVLLDAEDPSAGWSRAAVLVEKTAISDVRWTRLTRWRTLMAHFFDIPEVRANAAGFSRLELAGADPFALRLFAGWMASTLPSGRNLSVVVEPHATTAPLERVRLADGTKELVLRLLPNRTCVETAARVEGHAGASRVVTLGDQRLAAVLAEELRIRSRDLAFERALRAAEGA